MTPEQILKAVVRYEFKLVDYEPIRCDPAVDHPNPVQARQHAAWMCGEIRKLLTEGHATKAERWLCFIQGVTWTLGWDQYGNGPTINEFRDDNR